MSTRCRLRDLGVIPGILPPGKNNAITDVPGVKVGHTTLISGNALNPGPVPVRTGVTVVLPHDGDIWNDRVSAGFFALNGNGEFTGTRYVDECGVVETPIALTNTHSTGDVSSALARWMIEKYPKIGTIDDPCLSLVGECWDGFLNHINGFHVKAKHVFAALDKSSGGPVAEGNVGAGTGMRAFRFKGGIGTSSRQVVIGGTTYTVGVLVNCNYGTRDQLTICGAPVGQMIPEETASALSHEGSVIVIVATDAPLSPRQLKRLAKRAALGLDRTGSASNHSSGDLVLAFSTGRRVPRNGKSSIMLLPELVDDLIDPLFQAAVEATAESVWNALCMAQTMVGREGNILHALPLDRLVEIFTTFRILK